MESLHAEACTEDPSDDITLLVITLEFVAHSLVGSLTYKLSFHLLAELKDVNVFFDRKVDCGDYKPEDYRAVQSNGYRQRLAELRQRLGFGCGVDTFKDVITCLPASESLCR